MAASNMARPTSTIKSGDLVCLLSQEEEEDCFLSVSASTEDKCSAKTIQDKDTIFQVLPMTQYSTQESAAKRSKAKSELKEGRNLGQEQSDLEALRLENERNESTVSFMTGKEIVYGQIIQLVHQRTSKYLCSEDGQLDEDCGPISDERELTATLEKSGSKRCWFKVLPAQTNRTEGDKIGPSDKILLFNVVTGLFLHQTNQLDQYGNYELAHEDGINATAWKMLPSDVGGSRHRAVLHHGEAMRLFHGNCGYLYGTGDSTVKCRYYHNGLNDMVSGYKSTWVSESTEIDSTRHQHDENDNVHSQVSLEIHWSKPIRFRLFGTDKFLCVSTPDDASSAGAGVSEFTNLALTPDKNDTNTVFRLASPNGEAEEIAFGSDCLVQCVSSKDWIHMSEDAFGYPVETKGYTDSDVFCSKKYSAANSLCIKMVPKSQLNDYDFVAKRIPILRKFYDRMQEEGVPADEDDEGAKHSVVAVLADLVKYLTICDNDNPFEREGTPIVAHQRLLGKPAIIDLIVAIATANPQHQPDVLVTQLAFRLLKQISKHNYKLGIQIYKRMPIEQVTKAAVAAIAHYKRVPIAQTYYEIFKDNSELLYSLSPVQLKGLFQLLELTHDYHYFELLSTLTRYRGSIIHVNQKTICLQLAKTRSIIPKTRIAGGIVELALGEKKWISLLDFVWNYRDRNAVDLFFSLLKLYCDLCEDRNVACIKIITTQLGLTFNECFTNLKEQQLDPKFRAVYCKNLLHIFVDVFPQSTEVTAFKLVWYRVATKSGKLTGADSASTNQVYTIEEDAEASKSNFKYSNPSNVQEFLLNYIFDKYAFRFDQQQIQTGQPHLLLHIMKFARVAFQFGIFKKKEAAVVPRLREILDIDPDHDHTGKPRILGDELHQVLVQIKHEVLSMVERFYEIKDNTILAKEVKQLTKAPTEEMAKRQLQDQLLRKYSADDITHRDPMGLSGVLLRLLNHEDSVLTSRAIRLLKRVSLRNSDSANLLKLLPRISVLTKKQDKDARVKIENKLLTLQHLTSAPMKQVHINSVIEILDDFTAACVDTTSHMAFQKMSLSMNVHGEIINIIRRPLEPLHQEDAQFQINRIVIKCYAFLREFCYNNKANQSIMFSHVEFMINQLILYKNTEDVPEAIMQTIIAVFKDNHTLCRLVTERIVLPFVNMLFETKRHSTYVYMDFFQTIIKPAGVMNKANQNIAVKLLVSHKSVKDLIQELKSDILSSPASTVALADRPSDDAGPDAAQSSRSHRSKKDKERIGEAGGAPTKERLKLPPQTVKNLTAKQAREESRAGVISLLALCAEERNYFAEATCQRLLGLSECINVCHSAAFSPSRPANFYKIIEAYLHFVDEVYVNTESTVQVNPAVLQLPSNPLIWDLIKQFIVDVRQLSDNPKVDKSYESYVFNVVCLFLQHFYAKFTLLKATQLHKALSNELLDCLLGLRRNFANDPIENYILVTTIRALMEAGFQGLSPASKTYVPIAIRPPHFAADPSTSAASDAAGSKSSRSLTETHFFRNMSATVLEEITKLIQVEEVERLQLYQRKPTIKRSEVSKKPKTPGSNPTGIVASLLMPSNLDCQTYAELIVAQIRSSSVTKDFKLTTTCLCLVRQFVLCASDVERREIQDRFAQLDTPLAIIDLLRSPHPKVVAAAASALLSLLDEGFGSNLMKTSQNTLDNISQAFSSGGHQQFLDDILSIIEASKVYIKEMKRRTQTFTTSVHLPTARRNTVSTPSFPISDNFEDEVIEMTIREDGSREADAMAIQAHLIDPGQVVRNIYGTLFLLAQGYPIFKTHVGDIVRESVLYLKVFEGIINSLNIDLAIQIFATLKEVCKDAPQNQQVAIASQVLIPINRILTNSFLARVSGEEIKHSKGVSIETPLSQLDLVDPLFYEKSYDLKVAIVDFLFAITENADDGVVNDIISGLNFPACTANTAILSNMRGLNATQQKKAIALAASTFRLVKKLYVLDETGNKELKENLLECEEYCASRIGTVEVMSNKDVSNIYFPIPTGFRPTSKKDQATEEAFAEATQKAETKLTKKIEQHFLKSQISWGKSGEKVSELVNCIEQVLIREEFKEQTYNTSRLWYYFLFSGQLWWLLSFAISLAINILLLAYANDVNALTEIGFDAGGQPAVKVLGIIQSVVTALLMVSVFARRGMLRTRLMWKKKHPDIVPYSLHSWDQIQPVLVGGSRLKYFMITMSFIARDLLCLFSIFYFVASILGNTISPFFFAAHLLQVVVRSSHLKFAVTAFSKNAPTIALLVVLLFNGIYILSIFSYWIFQNQYEFLHDDGLPGSYCNSVWECLFTNLYYGVPTAGQLNQLMPAYDNPTAPERGGWLAWQLIFYFWVGSIMLNLVFALNVDTFGDLRGKINDGKAWLANSCLVCSIDRDAFQRKGLDFAKHLEHDHNKLHYLYFFAYLRERNQRGEVKQLSQLEQHVFDKIKANKSIDIFPIGHSIALDNEDD